MAPHRRFAFALCGATAAHLALLWLPLAEQPRATAAGTLQVRLSAPPAAMPSAPTVPRPAAAAPAKARPAPRSHPAAAPAAVVTVADAASTSAASRPSPVESTLPTGPTTDTVVAAAGEVRLALARHFRYPLLARRQGWQGEVLLAVQIAADGSLGTMTVVRSSGHAVLDRAALDALARITTLSWAPGTAFILELPVIYRLEKG